MRKKRYYLILRKSNNHIMGAFPRNKAGREAASVYVEKLMTGEKKTKAFIIK
jgi:hypothetical protein